MNKRKSMSGLETVLTGLALAGVVALGGLIGYYDSLDAKREIEKEAKTRGVTVEQIYKEKEESKTDYIDYTPMLLD